VLAWRNDINGNPPLRHRRGGMSLIGVAKWRTVSGEILTKASGSGWRHDDAERLHGAAQSTS